MYVVLSMLGLPSIIRLRLPVLDIAYKSYCTTFCRHNSTHCSFATQSRSTYPRMYKTKVFLEDGSSITIRSKEPRKFIQLPFDMEKLDQNEQRKMWLSRKTVISAEKEDDVTDDYDASKYKKFWK